MLKLPIVVLISGHFDPFHDGHLSYIKQARLLGDIIICIVSSDAQLMKKKGKVNIPEESREEIIDLILWGDEVRNNLPGGHHTAVNIWDTKTTLVAEALRAYKPDIFFRGGDKTLEDMPPEERQVCEELGIKIKHAVLEKETHGAEMKW